MPTTTADAPVVVTASPPTITTRRLDMQRGASLFLIEQLRTSRIEVLHGWSVTVCLIYAGDDEPNPDKVSAADVLVTEITPDTLTTTSDGTVCIRVAASFYQPVENLHPGDADGLDWDHDTWHPTEREAIGRAQAVARHLTAHGIDVSTDDRP